MEKALKRVQFVDRTKSNCVKYTLKKERFGTNEVLPLWVADMDFCAPKEVVHALHKRVQHPVYGYTVFPNAYYKAVKKHMKQLGLQVKKEQILSIPSIVMGINILLQTFCKKGEGVIVQTPIYPPFLSSVKNNGLKLLDNTLVKKERYEIDFEDFAQKAKQAKVFIFCNPHNPTGRVFTQKEVKKLAKICEQNNVLIISDEVHADIVFKPNTHTPIALFAPKLTITLNAPSKTYSLTGLSSAYAVIFNAHLKRALQLSLQKLGFHIANPLSIEATIAALNAKEYKKALLKRLEKNRLYLQKRLAKNEMISFIPPQGTFLLWLDCSKLGVDDSELQETFVHKLQLGLNPGIEFGNAGSGYMRLNFATDKKLLKKAVKQLEKLQSFSKQ